MEPIQQQIVQEGPRLWDVMLYVVWPAIAGAYGWAWILYTRLSTKIDLALANELKHITDRLDKLEG